MNIKTIVLSISTGFLILSSCSNTEEYKQDLLSGDKRKIIEACYELGEKRDTSAVKNLLYQALDPRITHDSRYKGRSINHIRIFALQKISNNQYQRKIDYKHVDTIATLFFRDWAIESKYLKDETEVDIYYLRK
jgi:hypothetical protein